jgi:hypothetical protein
MQLNENWTETKEALLEGLTGSKKTLASTLMDNQRRHLLETAGATQNGTGDIQGFQKIAIPMIRRIIPGTIGTELVGVQPLTGPVGLAYSLRFAFAEALDVAGTGNDIGVNDEAFSNNVSKMKRFYSANLLTGSVGTSDGSTTNDSTGLEAQGGRTMRLQVLKQTISAGSRKLQAKWTVEAQQDIGSQHGLNLENELVAALSAQIAHEIDNEILTDLVALASTVATYDFAAPVAGMAPAFIGDRYAELGVLVNKMANEIGVKTRRGPANWLVGSHLTTSLLQSAAKSVFAPAVQGSFADPVGNKMVGTLNGQLKVYSYQWGLGDAWTIGSGAATADSAAGEQILLGYKGGSSELDSGYFYCPYVPLMSSGVIMDPTTFSPAVSLMTRYGKATFTNAATSLGNSADYYARILVKNVAFS